MKKFIMLLFPAFILLSQLHAQDTYNNQMQTASDRLDKASTAKDYQQLANEFIHMANAQKSQWLPYYYAAFCNAKTGWLNQEDPDNIEPYANKAEEQIKKAQSLIDTATQKKELAEIYCVLSMVNRARVFMNPATYGRQYGPAASQFTHLALAINPNNPRALYLEGWEKYSTPKLWGGDKAKAKELLESAKQQLSKEPVTSNPHWGKKEVDELLQKLK